MKKIMNLSEPYIAWIVRILTASIMPAIVLSSANLWFRIFLLEALILNFGLSEHISGFYDCEKIFKRTIKRFFSELENEIKTSNKHKVSSN